MTVRFVSDRLISCTYHTNTFSFLGLIWSEIKQLWDVGLRDYIADMWNVVDFVTNSLYVATIALRLVAYYKVKKSIKNMKNENRKPSSIPKTDTQS